MYHDSQPYFVLIIFIQFFRYLTKWILKNFTIKEVQNFAFRPVSLDLYSLACEKLSQFVSFRALQRNAKGQWG